MKVEGDTVSVPFQSEIKVLSAELWHTSDDGPRAGRVWKKIDAELLEGKMASAAGLPQTANTWLFTFTDERKQKTSSEVGFR